MQEHEYPLYHELIRMRDWAVEGCRFRISKTIHSGDGFGHQTLVELAASCFEALLVGIILLITVTMNC